MSGPSRRLMRIRISTFSGQTFDFEANWGNNADRVAFERRFQTNSRVMKDKFGTAEYRDEWMAFMVWRSLRRQTPNVADFEEFLEDIDEFIFGEDGEDQEEDVPDPTETAEPLAQVAQLGR
jgi:hypothetical protein